MGLLTFLGSLYKLDTLDTRFTTSSSVPYQTIIDARQDAVPSISQPPPADGRAEPRVPPPRWRTPEFYFYYVIFALAVPYMFWVPYTVSRPSDPRYHKYVKRLSDGWVPGRKIDITDAQYNTFRSNIPYMALLLLLHPLLRRVWNSRYPVLGRLRDVGAARLEQRVSFDYAFGLFYLVALHGFSALKVLLILTVNHRLATRLPRQYIPVATWVFNISVLFANELCTGYRYEAIARLLAPPLVSLGAWLDGYGGIMSRWEILFNITILRLISFNLDYYWSIDKRSSVVLEKKQLDPSQLSERDRVTIPADPRDFSMRNYIAYAAYAPLYLAGPILTFNDYVSQSKYRAASIEKPRTVRYAVRFLLVLLAMELVLHFNYVGAISKSKPKWRSYTAQELTLLSFMNLHIIWLKLLIPWRFFRLWSLADGIDPPENMVRCVSNNYSTQLFWRSWHRSYNRWLIRYIYVPMGGAGFGSWRKTAKSIVTYLLVFTFVALWHDIQLRLLIWGWLIVLFMLPEWTASYLLPARRWESNPTAYRMLCCAGAVANVIMMICANLVGFALGLDGLQVILERIVKDSSGVMFILASCACLFVGIQVMFEIRQHERRIGVTIKC
ncbi:D-alanyl-lipoteichoic acid acyltransferase DltB, MBOAT superfamily [Geosmithia morbida]|uniref:D-alanyl-lipoteichoic acid acyltransferase DltB, MBOAT superfamily n=1 Tax=Geosmithia morbida TaxID=1094350 RepID=A0A9P5D2C4_9HYPO|nr:D-alanyl-lipoteichoic acid acyltransferase DltB, MBOAT superfamily [Geosmithia morbida]KAF4124893.1 D-alanyl-lipoteichoic acid acyltransferase DltB, MBOAT superfamily [Geosmithia morbida]